jgi:hypothetical protein
LGKWRLFTSFNGGFGQFFICFFLDFWSQIYSTPLSFSRHALLSPALRRRLSLLPEVLVMPVIGVRRVTCTRQRAFCFLVRVMATLRHFLAVLDGVGATVADLRLGGVYCWRVSSTRRRSWRSPPLPFCRQLCFWVSALCCVSSCFLLYSLFVYC